MNRSEYIEYELEENVKKREKLKLDYQTKSQEYLDVKNGIKDYDLDKNIEEKKQFLLTLQDRHKKELDELKYRHQLEIDSAQLDYQESKYEKLNKINRLKSEKNAIIIELSEIKEKNKELNKERSKLRKLNQISVTSHAIVQYLDRGKGQDIKLIKKEFAEKIEKNLSEVKDHEFVDFLVKEGRIIREDIEREMVPEYIKKIILSDELLGTTSTFKRKDGYRLVVKNSSIVTFLPKDDKPRKKGKYYGEKKVKKPLRRMKL